MGVTWSRCVGGIGPSSALTSPLLAGRGEVWRPGRRVAHQIAASVDYELHESPGAPVLQGTLIVREGAVPCQSTAADPLILKLADGGHWRFRPLGPEKGTAGPLRVRVEGTTPYFPRA
jgi:hypothetical protein